jgi:hypothetical protein
MLAGLAITMTTAQAENGRSVLPFGLSDNPIGRALYFDNRPCYETERNVMIGEMPWWRCEEAATAYIMKRRQEEEQQRQAALAAKARSDEISAKFDAAAKQGNYRRVSFNELALSPERLLGVKVALQGFYRVNRNISGAMFFGTQIDAIKAACHRRNVPRTIPRLLDWRSKTSRRSHRKAI